jgi:hypothetical protein
LKEPLKDLAECCLELDEIVSAAVFVLSIMLILGYAVYSACN